MIPLLLALFQPVRPVAPLMTDCWLVVDLSHTASKDCSASKSAVVAGSIIEEVLSSRKSTVP